MARLIARGDPQGSRHSPCIRSSALSQHDIPYGKYDAPGHHEMYGDLGLYMFIGIEDANKIMVWDVLQVMAFLGMVSA